MACLTQGVSQIMRIVFFRKLPHEKRSVLQYSLIVCNSGFFGIPVLSALLGPAVLPYCAVFLIPQRFSMWLIGVPLFSNDRTNMAVKTGKTLVNPNMIAIYVGLLVLFTQTELPAAIAAPVVSIGACTMPLAMLLIGSILAEIKPSMLFVKEIYFFCFLRLILIPGIVFICCILFGLREEILQVSVLMSGMPAATTTSLLALKYGADEVLGSAIIVVSTIFFFALLPVWMTLFSLV